MYCQSTASFQHGQEQAFTAEAARLAETQRLQELALEQQEKGVVASLFDFFSNTPRATLMSSCCREDVLRNPLPKARKNMFLSQIQELAVHASLRKIQQGTSKNRTVIENRPAKSVQRISSSSP